MFGVAYPMGYEALRLRDKRCWVVSVTVTMKFGTRACKSGDEMRCKSCAQHQGSASRCVARGERRAAAPEGGAGNSGPGKHYEWCGNQSGGVSLENNGGQDVGGHMRF